MAKRIQDSAERAGEAAEVLKAIAHPLRLRLVAILAQGELHVGALAERLGVPQAIVSQQLRVLRMRQLVGVTRQGGLACYRLSEEHLRDLLTCIEGCLNSRPGRRR